jgi:hypothetical protein
LVQVALLLKDGCPLGGSLKAVALGIDPHAGDQGRVSAMIEALFWDMPLERRRA